MINAMIDQPGPGRISLSRGIGKPEASTPVHALSGKRVVVVEDEGITQLQLQKILRSAGAEIVGAARDGREAVSIVLRERPDIVLMDVQMPVMNGLDAAEQILRAMPVCIAMLTANSDQDSVQRAACIGAAGYIIKPVTAATLLPQLAAAFAQYNSR